MILKQINYIGDNPNGISLQLYKSYKTVSLSESNPTYVLTSKDNNTLDAVNYYKLYFPNSLECIIEGDNSTKANSKVEDISKIEELEESKVEEVKSSESEEIDNSAEVDYDKLLEDVELADIKAALSANNPNIKLGRKSKSTIISEFSKEYKEVFDSLIK